MHEKVVITGLGVYTSAGKKVSDFWERIVAGKDNVQRVELPIFKEMRSTQANRIDIDCQDQDNKLVYFALNAAQEALDDTGLAEDSIRKSGVVISSANGSIDKLEGYKLYSNFDRSCNMQILQYPLSYTLQCILDKFKIEGPSNIVSTACASGNIAISIAYDEIISGNASCMLVGGSDILSYTIMGGFNALRAISESKCRPFDSQRDGIVIGEGAAFLVLESLSHAKGRNANIYCEISGYAHSCDAYNFTNPDGIGLQTAIIKALSKAGISSDDINYINAHGTATAANDKAEIYAISNVLKSNKGNVPISSTKPIHGHMLGSSGTVEAIVCALSIKNQIVPPNINIEIPESNEMDFPKTARRAKLNNVISTSQAFGGINSVLVFRKASFEYE